MSESEKERKSLGYSIQTFNDLDWDEEADFDIESKAFRKYTISLVQHRRRRRRRRRRWRRQHRQRSRTQLRQQQKAWQRLGAFLRGDTINCS